MCISYLCSAGGSNSKFISELKGKTMKAKGKLALEEKREKLKVEIEEAFSAIPPDMAKFHRLNKEFQKVDEAIRKG